MSDDKTDDFVGWARRVDDGPLTGRRYHSFKDCGVLWPEQNLDGGIAEDDDTWSPKIEHYPITPEMAALLGMKECNLCRRRRERGTTADAVARFLVDVLEIGSDVAT